MIPNRLPPSILAPRAMAGSSAATPSSTRSITPPVSESTSWIGCRSVANRIVADQSRDVGFSDPRLIEIRNRGESIFDVLVWRRIALSTIGGTHTSTCAVPSPRHLPSSPAATV